MIYKQIGAGITFYAVGIMALTHFIHLPKDKLILLRIILIIVGAAIGGAFAWYKKRTAPVNVAVSDGREFTDIAAVLDEAERKLAASKLPNNPRLNTLPVIIVTGPNGATKTTTVLQSGLEPELLAGQVHQDGAVAPTDIGNVWLTQRTAIVEVGPKAQGDFKTWALLTRRLAPKRFAAAIQQSKAMPRAAVVCFECEHFLNPGAAETVVTAAQAIRTQLLQIASSLGVNLPVYVLFTKLDRLAFFTDYARTFSEAEARQVLGVSVPPETGVVGVYGEREAARLTSAFDQLAASLSDKRTELLPRESEHESALSAYEFPREFRKMRTAMVKFLVELCRPSQLAAGPFLRGFYFCGVRPVTIEEQVAAVERPRARVQQSLNPEATAMFASYRAAVEEPSVRAKSSRKRVPQWVFLPHFYNDVVLGDDSGQKASAASSKTYFLRHAAMYTVILLALAFGALSLVSYLKNRALEHQVETAAATVSADTAKAPTLDSLTKLDSLRASLVQLREYQREHPPLMLRWGLYSGSALLPEARALYFDRFNTLLFSGVQSGLLSTMQSWPDTPPPNADYPYSYDSLKAYLETTSNPDKATQQFLPGVLEAHWEAGQTPDAQRASLARKQFEFYTSELIDHNPYSSKTDSQTVEHARHYLAQFAGVARVYQAMLTNANQVAKPIVYNSQFPGSSQVVINVREIPGAFTKPGYAWMAAAIKDPGKYVSGERWVLGDQAGAVSNTPNLQQAIQTLYTNDYISAWRDYFKRSVVVRYTSLEDAAKKLGILSAPNSPLLALFWLASQNTSIAGPAVNKAFKPLYNFMPPSNVDQYVGSTNSGYMTALTTLQSAVAEGAKMPPEQAETAGQQINASANSAMLATKQTALNFGIDADAHLENTIEKLIEDPITYVQGIAPNGPSPAPLNGAGAGFCGKYRSTLMNKYPFDPRASAQASLDDVAAIFAPQHGAFWQLYQDKLSKLLVKQGNTYSVVPGQKPELLPRFVNFFNNAARFSDALYANGTSQAPKLTFSLQPVFSNDIQSVTLAIDGQAATFKPGSPAQPFTWPGAGGVRMVAHSGADALYPSYDGLWAVFQFFNDADKPIPSPEWMLKSGLSNKPVTSPLTNQPIVVHFNLDMMGNPPVFQKGYFQTLGCVSEVAK